MCLEIVVVLGADGTVEASKMQHGVSVAVVVDIITFPDLATLILSLTVSVDCLG
jgi:hypothetical protein